MIRAASEQRFEEVFSKRDNPLDITQNNIIKTLVSGNAFEISAIIDFFFNQTTKQHWLDRLLHKLGFKKSIEYHWKEARTSMYLERLGEFNYKVKFVIYRKSNKAFEDIREEYYFPVIKTSDIKTGKTKFIYMK
jgi:ABC-type Fe3+-citrate transport system substrate-binding protein